MSVTSCATYQVEEIIIVYKEMMMQAMSNHNIIATSFVNTKNEMNYSLLRIRFYAETIEQIILWSNKRKTIPSNDFIQCWLVSLLSDFYPVFVNQCYPQVCKML